MPLYTFKNTKTDEEYDEVMTYEELQEYLKQEHIHQVFKMNIYKYSDGGGIKDQFTDWAKDSNVSGKGSFDPYGKGKKGFSKLKQQQEEKKGNG